MQSEFSMAQFRPWQGQSYKAGLDGVRVLVLGESHYGGPECDYPEFTQHIVKRNCFESPKRGQRKDPYFTKIAVLLCGLQSRDALSDQRKQQLWDEIAFFNYVDLLPSRKVRPSKEQWERAHLHFEQRLSELSPHAIIVTGKELWTNLPRPCSNYSIRIPNGKEVEVRQFRCADTAAPASAIMIQHPSSRGMRYADWEPRISALVTQLRSHTKAGTAR